VKFYRHYKGGLYLTLVENATIEKTHEPSVVYMSLKNFKVWIRPSWDFHEEVEMDNDDGLHWIEKRFQKISLWKALTGK
jgi:hypothetical protein